MYAINLLKEDHQKVKQLFEQFESTEDPSARREIVQAALKELKVHASLEEELFYPAVKQEVEEEEEKVDEAEEEHHVVKLLIKELEKMEPDDPKYHAKFTVLAENVKHHIEEEESEMLPKAEEAGIDMESLGEQMSERKQQLQQQVEKRSNGSGRSKRSASGSRSRGRRSKS